MKSNIIAHMMRNKTQPLKVEREAGNIGVYSDVDKMKAREKLKLASQNLLLTNPFFGYLLMSQKVVESSQWLSTAAVDGECFYFNVGFILELTTHQVQFLICHELLHIIYGHISSFSYPNGLIKNKKLLNYANDYIVNQDSVYALDFANKEVELLPYILLKENYKGYSSDEVYEELLNEILEQMEKEKEKEEKENGSNGEGKGQGGTEGGGNSEKTSLDDIIDQNFPEGTLDEHLDFKDDFNPSEKPLSKDKNGELCAEKKPSFSNKEIERKIEKLKGDLIIAKNTIVDGQGAGGQGIGNIPSGVIRVINELTEPVFDWRRYIRKSFLGVKKRGTTWTKPNRRSFGSDIILPSKKKEKAYKIHVALDTSGSISDYEIRDFLSEVRGAARQMGNISVTIWTFDTEVHNPVTYNKNKLHLISNYEIQGNGGTLFLANYEYMKDKKIKPDLFIMFTDGMWADAPGIAGFCPTLYVIHHDYKKHVEIDKKYGNTIWYKKDKKTVRY